MGGVHQQIQEQLLEALGLTLDGRQAVERDVERVIPDKQAKIVLYCGGGIITSGRRATCGEVALYWMSWISSFS